MINEDKHIATIDHVDWSIDYHDRLIGKSSKSGKCLPGDFEVIDGYTIKRCRYQGVWEIQQTFWLSDPPTLENYYKLFVTICEIAASMNILRKSYQVVK
jgi:hypothetical protein